MSDIEARMNRLMEEQAEEAAPADEPKLKELASHVVLGMLPHLPDDLDEGVDDLAVLLKKLSVNKSLLKRALMRFKVGTRAKQAAKALVKGV